MKMPIRETVRSGRRENFYVTDNSFIDHYARDLQPVDVAVYHALERYANCHTRSTWVGTAKVAEVLNVSQRTVQRSLKALEDFKLIRIVQTSTVKMYFIVPVPPRAKSTAIPLFDQIDEEQFSLDTDSDTSVAWTTPASSPPSSLSRRPSLVSRPATTLSSDHDTADGPYKEEQNLLNKTSDQDLSNQTSENEIKKSAQRILTILSLPDSLINAAVAAVEQRTKQTKLSFDGIVQDIVTAANIAERRGTTRLEFLEDFLADYSARQMLRNLDLPVTNSLISTVKASVKAEVTYAHLPMETVADLITSAALDDRRKGVPIDRFYFEGVKWRSNSNVRVSKAEQRKLTNLEVNARVKQRFRDRLNNS